VNNSPNKSYEHIIKSTAIMGVSTSVTIAMAILRTKILALLLGPAGVGLMGIYSSIMSTASTIAGMGLSSSGVRQIASSGSADNSSPSAVIQTALKWTTIFLAFLGAAGLVIFCRPVSEWTFGTDDHAGMIAILAIGVMLSVISGSQTALINGLRRIRDLAGINIQGAVLGAILAITTIFFIRNNYGIALFLIAGTFATFCATCRYTRRIPHGYAEYEWANISAEIKKMLKLGFVFMTTALMSVGTLFLVRVIIMNKLGIEATGFFQASWSIAMLYTGFVLQAMATDFFPRLSALSADQSASNNLVNEQAEVALLLSTPIIICLLAFAPVVINLLYSPKFFEAVDILRWQIIGTIFQIFSWPIGFIIVANGMSKTYFFTDLSWHLLYIGIVWFGINYFGVNIAGIGFFIAYVILHLIIYFIVRKVNHFTWFRHNIYLFISLCFASSAIFSLSHYSLVGTYVLGGLLTVLTSIYSFAVLRKKLGKAGIKSII
jgi:enterobacterial common antigen flippase